jgi:hypothetical protein
MIWNTILNVTFPPTEGYATGPEQIFGSGPCDLWTLQIVQLSQSGSPTAIKFSIVECKAVEYEGQGSKWTQARGQLHDYLNGMTNAYNNSTPLPRPVYGGIAVGKYVRLYRYHHNENYPLFLSLAIMRCKLGAPLEASA